MLAITATVERPITAAPVVSTLSTRLLVSQRVPKSPLVMDLSLPRIPQKNVPLVTTKTNQVRPDVNNVQLVTSAPVEMMRSTDLKYAIWATLHRLVDLISAMPAHKVTTAKLPRHGLLPAPMDTTLTTLTTRVPSAPLVCRALAAAKMISLYVTMVGTV
jgi:hypothetical protein